MTPNKRTKIFYKWNGKKLSARQLIDEIDFDSDFAMSEQEKRDMASKLRARIKIHGLDKAMESMKKAKPAVSRSEYTRQVKTMRTDIELTPPNPFQDLEDQYQNLKSQGVDEEEIFIKLKNTYVTHPLRRA